MRKGEPGLCRSGLRERLAGGGGGLIARVLRWMCCCGFAGVGLLERVYWGGCTGVSVLGWVCWSWYTGVGVVECVCCGGCDEVGTLVWVYLAGCAGGVSVLVWI